MECPNCHTPLAPGSGFCKECGRPVGKPKSAAGPWELLSILGVIGALILFVLGWVVADSAVQQAAYFAAAAVLGILARMAQASRQHAEAMRGR
jgi:hypothetical protein